MSSIGFPVTGDKLYGGSTYLYKGGQLLHAYPLTFYHSILKKEMSFTCDIPQYFKDILDKLE
jgi:23S rRNA pseudouridine1911/1915/1917 synthase